ncbi:MAG: hypothetical protein R3D98_12030 [Candidatus Krumholzibacteriia bacterium]
MNANDRAIASILKKAKALAREYRELTGKPLGITGEVAEVAAAQLLHLQLADARQARFDATREIGGKTERIQIKGRWLADGAKPGQRVGAIKLNHEWDVVMLVLLDKDYEVSAIWEARRPAIKKALRAPGSKAREERGQLSVSKFKQIGVKVWPSL